MVLECGCGNHVGQENPDQGIGIEKIRWILLRYLGAPCTSHQLRSATSSIFSGFEMFATQTGETLGCELKLEGVTDVAFREKAVGPQINKTSNAV